jgi:hypothetical protein
MKKTILLLTLTFIIIFSVIVIADCPDGMVSYWRFEDNIDDFSGTNDGTNHGGSFLTGKLGNALSVDGDYAVIPYSSDFDLGSDDFTINLWVNGNSDNVNANMKTLFSQWQTNSVFTNSNSWSSFDAGSVGGLNTKGYRGSVFDGRYVYFVPNPYGSVHGRFLRYDTQGNLSSVNSWDVFDAGNIGGLNTKGYTGGVFDGRYIYFVPSRDSSVNHGHVLRYDTQSSFTSSNSWSSFNAGNIGGLSTKGYYGGVFDGRYVYFVARNDDSSYHGRVLRYDTQNTFSSGSSWSSFDAGNIGGLSTKGYFGGVFDGRYVYFVPNRDSSHHGRVLRYDTQNTFSNSNSWSSFNAGNIGGLNTKGYGGGVFDGRYVYFVPSYDGSSHHGRVLRYDTESTFSNSNSWSSFDAGSVGGLNTKGYQSGVFDGRYVYFVPNNDGSSRHGRVLRYDTESTFSNSNSWSSFDAGSVGSNTKGYQGGVFDGRYVYFVPYHDDSSFHGKVLRYDTTSNSSFKLNYADQEQGGGLSGSPYGINFYLSVGDKSYNLATNEKLSSGWNMITIQRDNDDLKLLVNNVEKDSKIISGSVTSSSLDLRIGNFQGKEGYDGLLDELAVYNFALNSTQLNELYEAIANKGVDYCSVKPIATTFGGTDLNTIPDLTQVEDFTITKSEGSVKWNNNLNLVGEDLDSNINLGADFISLNVNNLHSSLNTSAEISFVVDSCISPTIYYVSEGFYDNFNDIKSNGIVCPPEICSDITCNNNILTFTAAHFDGFGGEGDPLGDPEVIPEFTTIGIILAVMIIGIFSMFIWKKK